MADDLSSGTGTRVPDSDFSNDLFTDADDLWLDSPIVDNLWPGLLPPDNELFTQQEPDAPMIDQQNLEGTSSSILDRDWGYIYGTSSGNYGSGSGRYNSSECRSVGSEAQSQSSVQGFQPWIASYGQKIDQDESNQKSALPSGDEVPKLGMVFSSEQEGYEFYTNYATKRGFSVRKGKTQRLTDGTIRKRSLYCSKEGFRSESKSGKARKYQRKETRIGCNAMVQFTHNTDIGKWVITHIVLEHNHDTNVPNHGHITCSSTNISEENAGIDTANNVVMVEKTVVGNSPGLSPFVNFSKDYLCNEKINILSPEDSQSLLNFLNHLQLEDPSFFYTVQLDAQSRIINFFWRDGRSKIDYEYFGDVLILDTTFRIEKYDIICAFLLGVNHHRQYIFFGCAFLLDDSTDSFIWLFKTFVKAMGKCQPRAIFTDMHQSISEAVELELHETQHRIGVWYINQNARKHISEAFKLPHFEDEFNKYISSCTSKDEFSFRWQVLFEIYKLRENPWVNTLYKMQEKWSPGSTYSAGIESFHGFEYINNVFHNLVRETTTLSKFVERYLGAAEQLRRAELYEDFCCNKNKWPMILENNKLEKHAADAYTGTIFKLFQKELHRCQLLVVEEIASNGVIFMFKITDEGHRHNFVEFNCFELKVTCSCKNFESTGILCSHALKVLAAKDIDYLPAHYILKRWTKSAKYEMVANDCKQKIVDQSKEQSSSFTSRVMYKVLNIITKSVAVEESQKIVQKYLDMALKEVEDVLKVKATINLYGRDAEIHHRNGGLNGIDCMEAQRKVSNPPCSSQESLTKRKSCDDAVIHCWPLKEARNDGDNRGSCTSSGSQHNVGENSQKHPCMPTENMQMPLAMQKPPRNKRKLPDKRPSRIYLRQDSLENHQSQVALKDCNGGRQPMGREKQGTCSHCGRTGPLGPNKLCIACGVKYETGLL
ncbi:protein FAR1-RELATED SEQUENCE 5-like isoform X2 [Mangifera indica]|uniref:protein FAR1-RELATED SEQUENCE 5-like isoform X2 n=1 Tax=Mangifera indica TaxID=29780 RepID=UPI001CFAF8F7|nr:protein FAR1-RELATED SEQUENCE 5-like isoform X2 [Mangifera indica]